MFFQHQFLWCEHNSAFSFQIALVTPCRLLAPLNVCHTQQTTARRRRWCFTKQTTFSDQTLVATLLEMQIKKRFHFESFSKSIKQQLNVAVSFAARSASPGATKDFWNWYHIMRQQKQLLSFLWKLMLALRSKKSERSLCVFNGIKESSACCLFHIKANSADKYARSSDLWSL